MKTASPQETFVSMGKAHTCQKQHELRLPMVGLTCADFIFLADRFPGRGGFYLFFKGQGVALTHPSLDTYILYGRNETVFAYPRFL